MINHELFFASCDVGMGADCDNMLCVLKREVAVREMNCGELITAHAYDSWVISPDFETWKGIISEMTSRTYITTWEEVVRELKPEVIDVWLVSWDEIVISQSNSSCQLMNILHLEQRDLSVLFKIPCENETLSRLFLMIEELNFMVMMGI